MATGGKKNDLAPELAAYALMWSFSHTSHHCSHDSSPPIAVYTVTGRPQYCNHLGPTPERSVRWYTQRAATMCMSPRARDEWWCTVPISTCVVSNCYASLCNLYKLLLTTLSSYVVSKKACTSYTRFDNNYWHFSYLLCAARVATAPAVQVALAR